MEAAKGVLPAPHRPVKSALVQPQNKKKKKRTKGQQQRHQWFNRPGDLTCLNQKGAGTTSHHGWQTADRTWQQPSLWGGRWGGAIRLDHQSSGNKHRGRSLTAPQANDLHWADIFPLITCHSGTLLI